MAAAIDGAQSGGENVDRIAGEGRRSGGNGGSAAAEDTLRLHDVLRGVTYEQHRGVLRQRNRE